MTDKSHVMVCFLPASSALLEKHWLNSMAAKLAPSVTGSRKSPMVHSELFFPHTGRPFDTNLVSGKSCGIHYGGKVFLADKVFSKRDWLFRRIDCTPEQQKEMQKFCESQVDGGFNRIGYFAPCNPSSWFRSTEPKQKWYCSELTAHALAAGGVIPVELARQGSVHPEKLYQCLEDLSYVDCGRNLTNTVLIV